MTSFDHQENNIYFETLIVNPERWMVIEQEEDFYEFG